MLLLPGLFSLAITFAGGEASPLVAEGDFFFSQGFPKFIYLQPNGGKREMVPPSNTAFKSVGTETISFDGKQIRTVKMQVYRKEDLGGGPARREKNEFFFVPEDRLSSLIQARRFYSEAGELYVFRPPDLKLPGGRWDQIFNADCTPYCEERSVVEELQTNTSGILQAAENPPIEIPREPETRPDPPASQPAPTPVQVATPLPRARKSPSVKEPRSSSATTAGEARAELQEDLAWMRKTLEVDPNYALAIQSPRSVGSDMSEKEKERVLTSNADLWDAREGLMKSLLLKMKAELSEERANRLIVTLTLWGEFRGQRSPSHLYWAYRSMANRVGNKKFPKVQREINPNFGDYGDWLEGFPAATALARNQFSTWNIMTSNFVDNLKSPSSKGADRKALDDIASFVSENAFGTYEVVKESRSELRNSMAYYVSPISLPKVKVDDRKNWQTKTDAGGRRYFLGPKKRVIYDVPGAGLRYYPAWWPKVALSQKLPPMRNRKSEEVFETEERYMVGGKG